MKKVLMVFGTRPEAIKMCPLYNELKSRKNIDTTLCVTGQHRQMLDQVLDAFGVAADFDLSVMQAEQTLFDVTTSVMQKIRPVLEAVTPDLALVHGDTTTTFAAAMACFYQQIPVGHVEAGLRTYNVNAPFPEEFNRQSVGIVAKYHFSPTEVSRGNLIREGKDPDSIFVTGNTAIDALKTTIKADYRHPLMDWLGDSRMLLITAHRRENLGGPMRGIFRAIRRVVEDMPDVKAVYPVHLNPAVRAVAAEELGGVDRIRLIEPLDVLDFHNFMNKSYLILSDSGGVQEEAPSLAKPVLVLRETTERPEGVAAGTLKLVGTHEQSNYDACRKLLTDKEEYEKMAKAANPYGDGFASKRIADILEERL